MFDSYVPLYIPAVSFYNYVDDVTQAPLLSSYNNNQSSTSDSIKTSPAATNDPWKSNTFGASDYTFSTSAAFRPRPVVPISTDVQTVSYPQFSTQVEDIPAVTVSPPLVSCSPDGPTNVIDCDPICSCAAVQYIL